MNMAYLLALWVLVKVCGSPRFHVPNQHPNFAIFSTRLRQVRVIGAPRATIPPESRGEARFDPQIRVLLSNNRRA
jgi:hypothetical protein